jgi:hypothetical protein
MIRMILAEALPQRRSLLYEIGVVTSLRAVNSGFKKPNIPDTVRAPITRSIGQNVWIESP